MEAKFFIQSVVGVNQEAPGSANDLTLSGSDDSFLAMQRLLRHSRTLVSSFQGDEAGPAEPVKARQKQGSPLLSVSYSRPK